MWTVEREVTLRDMWARGVSASAMGRALGITRNSIIGKAHRLHLAPLVQPASLQRAIRGPRPIEPAPLPVCLWPSGSVKDGTYHHCGETALKGKPYCPVHYERAYIKRHR